jgi:hypothetical protein
MNPCCRLLRFIGESRAISNGYTGQCLRCGSIRHGAKSNWRVRGQVMKAVKDKKEKKVPVQVKAVVVDVNSLIGLSTDKMIEQLRKMGVDVR